MQTLNVDKWIFVVLRHKNFCSDDAFAFCLLLLLLIEEFDCQSWKLAQNAFKCDEAAEVLFTPLPSLLRLALHPQHFDELLMSLITAKASPTSSFKCSYLSDTNRN